MPAKKAAPKPKKANKKPRPKKAVKPRKAAKRAGQPQFKPSDEQRELVEFFAAWGIPEKEIVQMIRNAKGEPIDPKTLRRHFREQLDSGHVTADLRIARGLFINATTPTDQYPGGNPTAQIFWAKTRIKRQFNQIPEPPPPPEQKLEQMQEADFAKRVLFILEANATAVTKGKKAKALPQK